MRASLSFRGAVAAAAIVAGLGLPLAHPALADEASTAAAPIERTAAENTVYFMRDTYPNFSDQIATAVSQGANEFRLGTDVTSGGTVTIPSSFTLLRGWESSFFSGEGPKTHQIGYANDLKVVFPAGSNITVDHIDFFRSTRRSDWVGSTVTVEQGATVTFSNVNFSNTPVINGTAIFENCTFATGKIENNGSATYTGTTVEPENIGTPSESAYAPLALSAVQRSFTSLVQGSAASEAIDVEVKGTKAAEATLSATVDAASGLTASVANGKLALAGTAETPGTYTVTLTARATKTDGTEDTASMTFPVTVVKPISAALTGELQAFVSTTGKTGTPTAASSAQPFAARASASSGGGGGLNNTPTNKLGLTVTEGDGEAVSILEFQRQDPNAQVSFSVTPAGSGMSASLLYDSVLVGGAPDTPGTYYVSATVTDGVRSATTNAVPFRIYSGLETLAERFSQLDTETADWDMEPYEIPNTGNATVPTHLKNIYGSHESGVYGQIGSGAKAYDSETLTIPAGADVTIHNMKINSSVRVVVAKGAKLTLVDSVAFGPVDVYGTISGKDATTTNTVTLHDGATMEDLDLNSHAHYLTDGSVDAPTPTSPVAVEGAVTVRGTNIVAGDVGAASLAGQNAIEMKPGSALTLAEGSSLAATGGKVDYVYPSNGGHGIVMGEGSKISGPGTLVAQGGESYQGKAGNGISGSGVVDVNELTATGGDSAPEGFPTTSGRHGTGGDAVSSTVLVRAKVLNATGGAGENPGSNAVTPYTPKAEDQNGSGNGSGNGSSQGSDASAGQGAGNASQAVQQAKKGKAAPKGARATLPKTGDGGLIAGIVAGLGGVIATATGVIHLRRRR